MFLRMVWSQSYLFQLHCYFDHVYVGSVLNIWICWHELHATLIQIWSRNKLPWPMLHWWTRQATPLSWETQLSVISEMMRKHKTCIILTHPSPRKVQLAYVVLHDLYPLEGLYQIIYVQYSFFPFRLFKSFSLWSWFEKLACSLWYMRSICT